MIFLALAAGGAAVLEVHRARHKTSKDSEGRSPHAREQELQVALQQATAALDREKAQRLQDQQATQQQLDQIATLEAEAAALQAAKNALEESSGQLQHRHEKLEAQAAELTKTNDTLVQQVADLKVESDAEVARTIEQIAELKREVAAALQSWTDGALSAVEFVESMAALGVEVQCQPDSLTALSAASTSDQGELQLAYDSNWANKMEMVLSNRERMNRLLTNATTRQAGTTGPPPLVGATFPTVKVPPRDAGMSRRLEMAGFSVPGLTPRNSRDMSQMLLETALTSRASLGSRPTAAPGVDIAKMKQVGTTAAEAAAVKTTATSRPGLPMPRIALAPISNNSSAAHGKHTVINLGKEDNIGCTKAAAKEFAPKRQTSMPMPRSHFSNQNSLDNNCLDLMRVGSQ